MIQPGVNSPPVDSSREDDSRSPSTSSQTSEPAIQDAQSQRQLLPKSGIDTPLLQVLPSSPIGLLENPETSKPVDPKDLSLPPAKVLQIMKKALPPDAEITMPANIDMERYAVEFIQFLTSEAAEIASDHDRKTIEGDDVLEAMRKTGFENYAQALQPYLRAYRAEIDKQNPQKRNGNPDLESNGDDVGAATGQDEDAPKSPQQDYTSGPVKPTE